MTTRKTHIVAIFALLYVLIATGVLAWVVYEVAQAGAVLQERVATIADQNAKSKVYQDLSNLVLRTKAEREALLGFVLTEDQTSSFLTDIESLGVSQGVTLTTDSLKVSEKEGSFNELLIQFSVEGTEENVKKMLSIFETLPYHSRVSSLTFSRDKTGKVHSTIVIDITLLKHV